MMTTVGTYRTKRGDVYAYELYLEESRLGIRWMATIIDHAGAMLGRTRGTLYGAKIGDPFSERAIVANAIETIERRAEAA